LHLDRDCPDLVCDVSRVTEPDLGTIAALARLQVSGCGLAWTVRLRYASPRLQELLGLCGLAGILLQCGESPLVDEGQPEQGEQARGVEEVVEPGDPTV
jgi:hypothetical protein